MRDRSWATPGETLSSMIESCQPRDGILQGTFNPEVFTRDQRHRSLQLPEFGDSK